MKRLILSGSHGPSLMKAGRAEVVIFFFFGFIWGELPARQKLASYLGDGSDLPEDDHWSDYVDGSVSDEDYVGLSLAEFCTGYDEIELWFDPRPLEQLLLVWLLDYLRAYPLLTTKLFVRLIDQDLIMVSDAFLAKGNIPRADVGDAELETASEVWQAYQATTPEACFALLKRNLGALPLVKPTLTALLQELPGPTGLGATELRMLELVARGYQRMALFYHSTLRGTFVFDEWQLGYLLDGLALGPVPAVAGLDEELRTLGKEAFGPREEAYKRSRLTITDFGKAVLRHEEDFSRHNPIDRWWGGTHLTNDHMWRWQPTLMGP